MSEGRDEQMFLAVRFSGMAVVLVVVCIFLLVPDQKIDKQTGYHCDDDFDSQNTDNSCDSNSRGYQNRKHFVGGGEKDCHQSTKRDDMPTIKP